MLEAELPQALQDASDAQVVVHIPADGRAGVRSLHLCHDENKITILLLTRKLEHSPLQVTKPLLPILSPFYFPRLFVDQADTIEAQHEFIGLNESLFGIFVFLKGLINRGDFLLT